MKRLMFAVAAVALGFGTGWSNRVVSADDAILLAFSSEHCPPCRAMQPVLASLDREGIPVRRVDVAAEQHLVSRFGIRETPTFVVLAAGQEVARLVGTQTATQLKSALATSPFGPHVPTAANSAPNGIAEPQTQLASIAAPAARRLEKPSAAIEEPMPSLAVANAVEQAEAATVRLRVHDGQGFGVGTGTIIDTHGDEALVLTCGHLFRETKGNGKIEVDLFAGGEVKQVEGHLVDYDADKRDIALVAIRPGFPVRPVQVIRDGETVRPGQSVFSFGCDRGDDPSRRDTRVTAVDKYDQHLNMSNIEIAGAPIDGRSGGGLFDHQGRLIGVCNAADYKGDVGIYTGPGSVHWQLDRVNLADLYRSAPSSRPSSPTGPAPGERLASLGAPGERLASLGGVDLEASGDRELIVVIRNRKDPEAKARTLELNDPSDELMRLLEAESGR